MYNRDSGHSMIKNDWFQVAIEHGPGLVYLGLEGTSSCDMYT